MIDTLTTLHPICPTTDYQYVLVANPKVPANTAAELVALANRKPGKLTYSSAGIGSGNHLAGALFIEAAGVDITHVPYRGTGQAAGRAYTASSPKVFARLVCIGKFTASAGSGLYF